MWLTIRALVNLKENEMELTDWFGVDKKPSIVGAYETREVGEDYGFGAQYWNGEYWCKWGSSHESAAQNARLGRSVFQTVEWRGLAEKP